MKELAEQVERAAAQDMAAAARESAGLALEAEGIGDVLVLRAPSLNSVLFNRILGLGGRTQISREVLAGWLQAYRAAGVDRFFVHLYDTPEPAALPAWLEEMGVVRYRRSWDKLGRGRAEALPQVRTPFVIRSATAQDAEAVAAAFAEGFDLSSAGGRAYSALIGRRGWDVLVAAEGGAAAAVGVLFTTPDAAYLAGGVTRRAWRGRGAQLALMVERCRMALDAGCRFIVSETGVPVPGDPQHSHHNMQRCGLRVLGTRHNYAPRALLWQHGRPG